MKTVFERWSTDEIWCDVISIQQFFVLLTL